MADQRLQWWEEFIGAGHPAKADTANRLLLSLWDIASNYGTLAAANTAAAASGKGLLINQNHTLTANTTFTVPVFVLPGGSFTKSSTYTLTINGPFEGCDACFVGFAAGDVTFGDGAIEGIRPEWWGAKADNLAASATANTAAFNLAAYSVGGDVVTLLLSNGIYQVTSTSGNFAIETHCSIKGVSAYSSRIINIGTGSAMVLGRTGVGLSNSGRYLTFQDFSVYGNDNSEDGIITSLRYDAGNELANASFINVHSRYHGRHGLVHRQAYTNTFVNCRFDTNGGLGVYMYAETTDYGMVGASTRRNGNNNGANFIGCSAIWNGGDGNNTGSLLHGGVRLASGTNISWIGGSVELNNPWGFIISASTGDPAYKAESITIEGIWCEGIPYSRGTSTIGGCILADGAWESLNLRDNYLVYGAASGQTGYGIYIKGDSNNYQTRLIDEGNHFIVGDGTGTAIKKHIEGIYTGKEQTIMKISALSIEDGTDAAHIKVTMSDIWNGDSYPITDNIGKDDVPTGVYTLGTTGAILTILAGAFHETPLQVAATTLAVNASGTVITAKGQKAAGGIIVFEFRNAATGVFVDLATLMDTGPITIYFHYLSGEYAGNY